MWGLIPGPWDHDLNRRQQLNPLSHAGAPFKLFFKSTVILFFKILFMYLFIWQREITSRWRAGRERGRERSRLPGEQRAWCGARSQDSEITTWAEGSGLPTEPPRRHRLLDIYSKKMKMLTGKDTCTLMLTKALFIIAEAIVYVHQ